MTELLVDLGPRQEHRTIPLTAERIAFYQAEATLAALADQTETLPDEQAGQALRAAGQHGLSQARLMGSGAPLYVPADGDLTVDPAGRLKVGGGGAWVSVASPRTLLATTTQAAAQTGSTVWSGTVTKAFGDSALLLELSCSAAVTADGTAQLSITVDGTTAVTTGMPLTAAQGHVALPLALASLPGLAAGSHNLAVVAAATTQTTASDTVTVHVTEQP